VSVTAIRVKLMVQVFTGSSVNEIFTRGYTRDKASQELLSILQEGDDILTAVYLELKQDTVMQKVDIMCTNSNGAHRAMKDCNSVQEYFARIGLHSR
jgi:hypothetical protein